MSRRANDPGAAEASTTAIADPLAGSSWSRPETVAGFTASPPNATLLQFAHDELARTQGRRALDLGCGVGRNALPLAAQGWNVLGVDLSLPMLQAASERSRRSHLDGRFSVVLAPMVRLPVRSASCDLVIAHGIWNLARSGTEFRRAIRDTARVAAPGAALFVFTFSRNTFPPETESVPGESFVFTQFSGEPQCFLTEGQLVSELSSVGFVADPGVALRELNRPVPGTLRGGAPVIHEGVFRYRR
jgi:SAM-dependent methyltransferase